MAKIEDKITILRFDELGSREQDVAKEITINAYPRVERYVNEPVIEVEIKKHEKDGGAVKFSIHVRVKAPDIVASVNQDDWDLARAMHMTFDNLFTYLEHKYKKEGREQNEKQF